MPFSFSLGGWDMKLSRRNFLKSSAALAVIAGCGGDGSGGNVDGSAPPADADPNAPDARFAEDGGFTPECLETEDNILGPFYKAGAPERNNLVEEGDPGVRLHLTGRVFTRAGETCAPVANAVLDFWQANDAAVYDTAGFAYRGKVTTDAEGNWELFTIIPGNYLNGAQYRPAHIHVIASGTGAMPVTTQLYFEGDPYNASDPWIRPSLIMPLTDDGQGGKNAVFDFVLRPA